MKVRGIFVASAALGLLAAAPGTASAEEKEGEVKCSGINGCNGQGACGAADGSHACAGKNSCHGKGWLHTTAEECASKGGKVIE
jgi:hypothetical protein